jgi:DNA-binding SARP family transcriptional activator
MTAGLRFAVLGPVRAWRGGAPVDLGPVRQQALLAALVLRPGQSVSRHELLDGVWGAEPPGTGAKVIPVYVHRLRDRLRAPGEPMSEGVISRDRIGYRFVGADAEVDAARLEEIAAEAGTARDSGDLTAAVETWAGALALFEGTPLTGLPGPFAEGERLRLAERRVALVQEKLECQLRLGRYAEAVAELAALTAMHPERESLAALMMRALYGNGRQSDALAMFTQVRDRLVAELAIEPGEELRRVHQAVLRADDAYLLGEVVRPEPSVSVAVPAAPVARVRNELPGDVGELVGRRREIARLTAPYRADAVSVVAVHGVAGIGKTALVVHAARALREQHPDGCLYVDLHGHSAGRAPLDPERALRRLLRAVGADDEYDDLDELAASWRAASASVRLLVVLDDAAGAEQVRPLLPAGAGSTVLLTSRRRLAGLDADHRISLEPLDIGEAEDLLAHIVGEPRADRERSAVRRLARLCDRLPLALRIAGARLQNRPMWTFEYLVTRLTDDGRRLVELTAEDRSVEAAFRLSYEQLPADAQRAFRALGLSPTVEFDPLTLAAMLDLPRPDAEQALESLVDASLLRQPAADRYRMHDLVAAYARRLAAADPGESAAVRAGVYRLFLAAARRASDFGPGCFPSGPDLGETPFASRDDAAAWLEGAVGELADVIGYASANGLVDEACWIAEALVDFLTRQGRHHECRAVLEIALPLAERAGDPRMPSSLRIGLGTVHGLQGNNELAYAWLTESLDFSDRIGDPRERARALSALGGVTRALGRPAEAVASFTEVLDLAERLDDRYLRGTALCYLGALHHQMGRYDEALDHLTRSLEIAEEVGSPRAIGMILCHIGDLSLDRGRLAEALVPLRRAADLADETDDVSLRALTLTKLGTAEESLGRPDTAIALHHRALSVIGPQANGRLEVEIRNRLGGSHLATGELAEARRQFQQVLALTDVAGYPAERARAVAGLGRCARRGARTASRPS